MIIDILSLFPDYFSSPFEQSIIKRARESGLITIRTTNVRDFAEGKHRKVDDRPYGGGPGMVMMPGPLCHAIRSRKEENSHLVYLTPQGKVLTAQDCERLAGYPHLVIVCGHYEGIDERVMEIESGERISVGNYVLTSGCPAAIVLIDALSRFISGVLGNEESSKYDSFQKKGFKGPQYTRPLDYEGCVVPEVLTSGHHAEIDKWREGQAISKEQEYVARPTD
jgi:tRNA (guanine37-N1)-methyltransferase